MISIDNVLVSDDIERVHFTCNLVKCKGICCVEGDAGAPLEENEIAEIEDIIDIVLPYLKKENRNIIEKYGVFDYDVHGSFVTPLINDKECVFALYDDKIALCAFEKAWIEKKIGFRKPISCHLYPIRITSYKNFDAVNYHKWFICNSAICEETSDKKPLYKYLKDPLIRKYGKNWYIKLVETIEKAPSSNH